MPHYASFDSLKSDIPAATITSMLDDDKDGVADPAVVEAVLQSVDDQIDDLLSPRFATPLPTPLPKAVKNAARVLLGEALYKRRNLANPKMSWVVQANAARAELKEIGAGAKSLADAPPPVRAAGAAILEPARTSSRSGALSV